MANFRISFEGQDAERNLVPASQAGQLLTGLSLAMQRVAFYLENDKFRYKGPYSNNSEILISTPQPGSLIFPALIEVVNNPLAQAIGVQLTAGGILALSKHVFKIAMGIDDVRDDPFDRIPPGTLDSVVESVTPPLRQAHNVIGYGARTVNVYMAGEAVEFNEDTKAYLGESEFEKEVKNSVISVSVLNGNDFTGRAYSNEFGRNVTFLLDDEISPESVEALTWSHTQYFRRRPSEIIGSYNSWVSPNGKIKKIVIRRATRIEDDVQPDDPLR
jgi:hypothetical protein